MLKIAIIGSGFSGTMTAVSLLRESKDPLQIDIYERSRRFFRGLAYGTKNPVHLLNVPSGKISAIPSEPDHFLNWLNLEKKMESDRYSFLPRKVYGEYLERTLLDAEKSAPKEVSLRRMSQEVTQIPDGYDAVVVAWGNFAPSHVAVASGKEFYLSSQYIRNPWKEGSLDMIGKDDPVLLLGTGLTMIDVALDLRSRGNRGVIYALSRRGHLAQSHLEVAPQAPLPFPKLDLTEVKGREVSAIFSWIREKGDDWRLALDSLRESTQELWKSLGPKQQARFLRHARNLWDVHRHRTAPQVGAEIQIMIKSGALKVLAGRVRSYEWGQSGGGRVSVTYQSRKNGEQVALSVLHVVNCTGPSPNYSEIDDSLVKYCREEGVLSPHPSGLGMKTSENGAFIDASGKVSDRLFTLGAARTGELWESVAVPELRSQAERLAKHLLTRGPRR